MAANTQDPAVEEAVEREKRDSYAVWAIPPDDVCRRIKKLMEGLRAEFGGPEIEPHIPIAGSIRMTREEALEKFQPYPHLPVHPYVAKVDAVVTRPSYYQCLCLLFHRSYELETSTRHCCGHFRIYNHPLPHLGLIYGNLTEEERKKAQQKVFSLDESIASLSFQVNRIGLYKIDYKDKTLKSREKIAERSLHFT